jgi:hypothetical protein
VGEESTLRKLSPDEDLSLASALLGTPQLHILCNEPTASPSDLASSLAISDPLLNETVLPVAAIDSTSNNPGGSETITQLVWQGWMPGSSPFPFRSFVAYLTVDQSSDCLFVLYVHTAKYYPLTPEPRASTRPVT